MIAAMKFIHVAALVCWCAALVALPLLIHRRGGAPDQRRFSEFRLLTHVSYIAFATPAALVAISAGTALVFLAHVFTPWMLAKLAVVAAMVVVHVWLGHMIQRSGEERRSDWTHQPLAALAMVLPLIALVLALVLTKPQPEAMKLLVPPYLLSPREEAS